MLASPGVSVLLASYLISLQVSSVSGAIDPFIAPPASDETTSLDLGTMPNLDSFHEMLGTTPDDWTVKDIQLRQEEVDVEKAEPANHVIDGGQLPANLDTSQHKDGICLDWTSYTWKECLNRPFCAGDMAVSFGRGVFRATEKWLLWIALVSATMYFTRAANRVVFRPANKQ